MPTKLRLLFALALAWFTAPVAAQCTSVWSSASPQPELTGLGKCSITWDPDGAGPAPERLVIGGSQLRAGDDPLDRRVMTWDGSGWQALGPGPGANVNGSVDALTVWNGSLVAGGSFTGGGVDRIAIWNGSAWQGLGAGFGMPVTGLTVWNGDLVAVGWTGGPTVQRWNGSVWTALPTPPMVDSIFAVTSFQGLLCVGGAVLGGPSMGALERWNGTAWLPSITTDSTIRCFAVRSLSLTLSTLYVGGLFTSIGGVAASRIASTSGGTTFTWQQVGNGIPSSCTHLHVRAILAGTAIVACRDGGSQTTVMQLSGSTFVPMGTTSMRSVSFYGGSYHGATDLAGPVACHRHDGSAWVPVRGPGIDGDVLALAASGNDVIVGGTIASISGVPMNNVARWNGTTFQPLGFGLDGAVDALLTLTNGDIVAGGSFSSTAPFVARWNGANWSSIGGGFNFFVSALCQMPNGDIIAAGQFTTAGGAPCFGIARWNGFAWAPLGAGLLGVSAVAARSDGTLFAGGAFSSAGGTPCNNIAQWNGTAWLPVGSGFNGPVHALAVRANDDVIAVGPFTSAGGVPVDRCARWDGSAWSSIGAASGDNHSVDAVLALPNGDVVAGRGFHQPSTSPDAGISRWNGSTWSGIGAGLASSNPSGSSFSVKAIAQLPNGSLIVGGAFDVADGHLARGLAKLSAPCPATVQSYGAGCSSAAGPLVLTTATPPWLGSTFRTATTGIAPLSLCLGVTGFTQLSLPLASLLAEGQPGCTLLASPDLTALLPQDSTGAARSSLALPNDPSLIGGQFFQQTIPLEFTGLFALAAVRGSNALALTIGTL